MKRRRGHIALSILTNWTCANFPTPKFSRMPCSASLVPGPHPSQGGKGVWLQYDIPLDPVTFVWHVKMTNSSTSLARQPLAGKRRVWSGCAIVVVPTPRPWQDQSDSLVAIRHRLQCQWTCYRTCYTNLLVVYSLYIHYYVTTLCKRCAIIGFRCHNYFSTTWPDPWGAGARDYSSTCIE